MEKYFYLKNENDREYKEKRYGEKENWEVKKILIKN